MGHGIRLLIADDNRNVCQMLQNYFQSQEDLSVVGVAYNGLEAMELIQTQEPDLIILDLVMPHLDGLGVPCYGHRLCHNRQPFQSLLK